MFRNMSPLARIGILLVMLAAGLLAGCSSAGGTRPASGQVLEAPDTTRADGTYTGTSEYRIGAQDLLQISVFGVKDLDQEVRVNSNGQVSLPLLGAVPAAGKTVQDLESELARRYAAGFLQNPQVSVFVKEYTSQRITLEGAVAKPGIYPITGRITLLQGIALAGGVDNNTADLSGIVLMRTINGKRMAAAYDLRDVRRGNVDDPLLYGDDIIVVEQSGSKTLMRRFIESVPVLGIFNVL